MSTFLYVDVLGGAAGDMLLGALLDAGAPHDAVNKAVSSVLDRRVEVRTSEVRRAGLRALALQPLDEVAVPVRRRRPPELIAAVERASIAPGVRSRAETILRRLADAEARVHGVAVAEVELDELGDDDTLVDVVGVAAAFDALGVERVAVSSLPMPPSAVTGPHPSPGPATLELLRGFTLRPSAAAEMIETVTPTAAAIFAALGDPAPELPEITVERVGYGAGARDPVGVPNVVRVLLGVSPSMPSAVPPLLVMEANVDDLTPELVPDALDALLGAGAFDVWATPILMKRGRPGITISALCDRTSVSEVRRVFFEATSTFGVRVHEVARPSLERRVVEVDLAEGGPRIRVKIGVFEGRAISAKPEHADVVEAARKLDRSVRSVHAQASAVAHALLDDERAR